MTTLNWTTLGASAPFAAYNTRLSPITVAIALAAVENIANQYNWVDYNDWDDVETAINLAFKELMEEISGMNMLGAIQAFAKDTAPDGWLECDGSTFDTSEYADLYAYLGTNILPDASGKLLMGAGIDVSLYDEGGSDGVALTYNNMPAHSHAIGSHTHSGGVFNVAYGAYQVGGGVGVANVITGATGAKTPTCSNEGYNERFKIIPPVWGVTWFIRAVV